MSLPTTEPRYRPPRYSKRRLNRRKITSAVIGVATVLILFLFALPAFWIVFTAFRPGNEINVSPPIWIPRRLTLDAFESLFGLNPGYASGIPVMNYLRNSSLTALISTTIALSVGTMTGYAFSRFQFKYHTFIFLLIMLSRAVPGVALGLPLFLLMRKYGLVLSLIHISEPTRPY